MQKLNIRLVIERADESVVAIVLVALDLLIGSWHRRGEPMSTG